MPPSANPDKNLAIAITLKLTSVLLFAAMSTFIRITGQTFPLGQVIFFRSAFAILPVVLIYAWRNELRAAVVTQRPLGHLLRGSQGIAGMFLNFAALARLPLMDATAISFASPLITVALAAAILKERVQVYRWSAVAFGFVGVVVMLWPYLDIWGLIHVGTAERTVGAACALIGAISNAGTVIQTRRLTDTETTSSIVFYFSLICMIAGLCTWPFGWMMPSASEFVMLAMVGILGGLSHILLTESYHYAPASAVAAFDYSAMLWAFLIGYFVFGELPSLFVYFGAGIVLACGLFVIWRERAIGIAGRRVLEGPPAAD